MNPKTVVILLVAFLFAVAGAIYVSQNQPGTATTTPSDQTREDALQVVGDDAPVIDPVRLGSQIKQLTVIDKESSLNIKMYDGVWWVTRPQMFRAKRTAIDEMLGVIGNLRGTEIERVNPNDLVEQNHEGPGLHFSQKPSVIMLNPGADPTYVRLHQRLGAGRAAVAIANDRQVVYYNADDTLHDTIDSLNADVFFAQSIDPLLMPEIGRVEIASGETASLLTQYDGRWRIGDGENAERALESQLDDYPGVKNYFELLKLIEIQAFTPYDREDGLQAFGLHQPLITVRFVPIDGEATNPSVGQTLRVGVPADPNDQTRFATYGNATDDYPVVFTIPTPVALAFAQDATAFRDPRMIKTPPNLIASLNLNAPQRGATFINVGTGDGGTLSRRPDSLATIRHERISAFLGQLAAIRAEAYVEPNFADLEMLAEVQLNARLDGDGERFTIYEETQRQASSPTVLIQREDEPVALRVPRSSIEGLISPASLIDSAR